MDSNVNTDPCLLPCPCYVECASINEIKPKEPIRCRECGHRIMYKKRTNRMVSLRWIMNLLEKAYMLN